jgi:hypothetical protein
MSDREEIVHLLSVARLTIGIAAEKPHIMTKDDFERLYDNLCRLSELLDLPTVQEAQAGALYGPPAAD